MQQFPNFKKKKNNYSRPGYDNHLTDNCYLQFLKIATWNRRLFRKIEVISLKISYALLMH